MSFQLSIPWRVALQQSSPLLPQLPSCCNQQPPFVELISANGNRGLSVLSQVYYYRITWEESRKCFRSWDADGGGRGEDRRNCQNLEIARIEEPRTKYQIPSTRS
jgi:hypothetical protein